jgi:hypothetical protein
MQQKRIWVLLAILESLCYYEDRAMRNDLLSVVKLFSAFCDHELRKTAMTLFASMLTVSEEKLD